MKVKIKQYHGKFRLKFFENYYVFRKKFLKMWDRFVEKGHEKMTVMFIPHNERKIFNFQISKFTISFFFLLFLVVLVTSSYAVIKHAAVKREEQRLLMTYEDIRSHLLRFEKLTNSVAELVEEMKPDVEELYELTAGPEEIGTIWDLDQMDKKDYEELRKLQHVLPEEIFTIKDIQKDIICTTNTIKTVKNFVDVRSKVVRDTPSIVPNPGHITSLFGWRRSPFGHGRDFHSGIDIAAPPGTEIRATAPGSVIAAGWSGGYGCMIRIKHKYGFESLYGHCQRANVNAGQTVKKGDVIGYVGQTGNATGNHCHYEIRLGDIPINPYPYMSRIW
ncbi:MAG TPA: M23 family metallopeptidase [Spirochaetota bacterium]|nr:M23 family metallopeptidase [Spirochaetota bacterium]HPC40069.1 M23 family metallopeptidase [Spirochaetota bacterium]HPL16867.1 M23 family metallopeptidase [Spirochaetota bacterium]HQF08473.1 M23 family metallopeptidase [Spirochaetota bacterium]HQH97290.1 M23 family metallopeptidase [Spirochaetota bacterium]